MRIRFVPVARREPDERGRKIPMTRYTIINEGLLESKERCDAR